MKKLTFLIPVLLLGFLSYSQDILVERNGFETKIDVVEVTTREVVFRLYGDPDGPTHRMKIGYIHKIIYENGTERSYSQMYHDAGRSYTKRREPALAFLFSFLFPGAGQFYNMDYGKAAIMCGGYIAGSIMLIVGSIRVEGKYGYMVPQYEGVAYAGGFMMGADLVWSVIDAPVRAGTINKRYDLVDNYIFENDKIGIDIDPYLISHSLTPGYQFNQPVYGATLRLTLK